MSRIIKCDVCGMETDEFDKGLTSVHLSASIRFGSGVSRSQVHEVEQDTVDWDICRDCLPKTWFGDTNRRTFGFEHALRTCTFLSETDFPERKTDASQQNSVTIV